jgi:hypothetical protein
VSNPDYSLLEEAINLGGQLRRSIDYATGEVIEVGGGAPDRGAPPFDGERPLSTAHIRPFLEWVAGASLLKASKGGIQSAVGGGKRDIISGFSRASRRRLMVTIANVRKDAKLPIFITLTYPESFPDPKSSKRDAKIFFQRLNRGFPGHGTIWKREPQERGAPHYHMMTWGCDLQELRDFVPGAWFDIAGGGDNLHLLWHMGKLGNGNVHCVQQVRSFYGVWNYAAKYLGKTFDVSGWQDKWTGRYWGVINRENIPFGPTCAIEVTEQKAVHVMRYQRRFAHFKHVKNSATIFCDADQWVKNILREEVIIEP